MPTKTCGDDQGRTSGASVRGVAKVGARVRDVADGIIDGSGELLHFVFGTKDMSKANLFECTNAVAQCQAATSEPFTDKMRCAVILMNSP